MNRFLFWDINAYKIPKIGIFGILGQKSKRANFRPFLTSNLIKISTPFSESGGKWPGKRFILGKKFAFPHKKITSRPKLTKILVLPKTSYNSGTSEHFFNLKTFGISRNLVKGWQILFFNLSSWIFNKQ